MNEYEIRTILTALSRIRAYTAATSRWLDILHAQTEPGNLDARYIHTAANDNLNAANNELNEIYYTLAIALLSQLHHHNKD